MVITDIDRNDFESNTNLSIDEGRFAPPFPPEVNDQWAGSLMFPEPPTQ